MSRRRNGGAHQLKAFGNQLLRQTNSALAVTTNMEIAGICVCRKTSDQNPYNIGQKKPTVREKKHFRKARLRIGSRIATKKEIAGTGTKIHADGRKRSRVINGEFVSGRRLCSITQ